MQHSFLCLLLKIHLFQKRLELRVYTKGRKKWIDIDEDQLRIPVVECDLKHFEGFLMIAESGVNLCGFICNGFAGVNFLHRMPQRLSRLCDFTGVRISNTQGGLSEI